MEALFACCLIPLDKNPGVCSTDVAKILRWIVDRAAIAAIRNDVITTVKALQISTEHDAGGEALVHSIHSLSMQKKGSSVIS